jgi:hypothetical protein
VRCHFDSHQGHKPVEGHLRAAEGSGQHKETRSVR